MRPQQVGAAQYPQNYKSSGIWTEFFIGTFLWAELTTSGFTYRWCLHVCCVTITRLPNWFMLSVVTQIPCNLLKSVHNAIKVNCCNNYGNVSAAIRWKIKISAHMFDASVSYRCKTWIIASRALQKTAFVLKMRVINKMRIKMRAFFMRVYGVLITRIRAQLGKVKSGF